MMLSDDIAFLAFRFFDVAHSVPLPPFSLQISYKSLFPTTNLETPPLPTFFEIS
jgi:hypothetical protein